MKVAGASLNGFVSGARPQTGAESGFHEIFLRRPRPFARSTSCVDHAEEVTLGVSEYREIFTGFVGPVPSRAEADQPFDLSLWVVSVEVQMQLTAFGLHLVDGYVEALSCGVLQDDKRVSRCGRSSRDVMKSVLPEGHHSSEVIAIDYD